MTKYNKYLPWILLIATLIMGYYWWQKNIIDETKQSTHNLYLNQLRGVAKLVIWEQDFTLQNTESIQRTYAKIIKVKETINSTVQGSMGFHIDLADSINTSINQIGDTVIVNAPLQNTYIQLDLATLHQVKESSIDPTLELKKEDVIKQLQKKAIDEFAPNIKSYLKEKDLKYQEDKLSKLIGKPVKINITSFPDKTKFNWNGLN